MILDEATSALDAESETLVNQALGALLAGHNTTISIAHRLSTIKRSDRIIVISGDGKVAEEGSYRELSEKKDGAFSKLMEWQLSGDSGTGMGLPRKEQDNDPNISDEEELEYDLEEETENVDQTDEDGEVTKVRKGKVTAPEAIAEKTNAKSG